MMTTRQKLFFYGFRETLPYLAGVVPFGLLYATIAVNSGFPPWLVIFFTVTVFAGSSQLVFIDLFQHLLSPVQAVLGSNIVNARHVIYSAAIGGKFSNYSLRWKMILGYLMTDQMYAVSESDRIDFKALPAELSQWFYFGSGFCTWFFWLISCSLGIVFGKFIPSSWNLAFSIPLSFMPLVFSSSKNKFAYITVATAVTSVYLFHGLPFGLGVFVSILLSSLVGYWLQKKSQVKK